jgi:protein arginine kinase
MSDEISVPADSNLGEWLQGTGPQTDIAICTRVRFARNVEGYRFSPCIQDEEARELTDYLDQQLTRTDFLPADEAGGPLRAIELLQIDELELKVLMERHLISREHSAASRPRSVVVNDRESIAIMVNEEDHLRMQVFRSGLQIGAAYDRAEELDEQLMRRVPLAFSEEFGFLTSCPTNTGTGLRVSVMLHLPGLVWAEEIEKATVSVQKIHHAVRGLYGEGSRALGDFYQVSNQVTLGRSEAQVLADVEAVVARLIAWEQEVRGALLQGEPRTRTLDRVYRALGTLERARILSSDETLTCLSAVRFGVQQGLLPHLRLTQLHQALLLSQPAHLQRLCRDRLGPADRDLRRASLIRAIFGQE